MNERSSRRERPRPPDADPGTTLRFDAVVQPGERNRNLQRVADLDLDRVPGAANEIRLLVTAEDCARLLERGYEVHLYRAIPVRPLAPELVESDESARAWLEERVRGIERAGGTS
ncbi:hypothetical protein ACWEPM_34090 [Streptomyces sp. NPDC004244]